MGFLAPWFLTALVGIGLPVWLHLLRKQQETPVPFAALMFLKRTEEHHTSRKQLRYIALFSLRALIVLLLALIFAQPFYREPLAASQSKRLTVIALDSSLSMQREGLPEAARDAALAVVNSTGSGAIEVIGFANGAEVLSEVTGDTGKVRDAIRAWKPGFANGSYAELAQAAISVYQNEKQPLDLHLVSDLQASGMPASFEESRLPPGTEFTAHPVGKGAGDNWAVDAVVAPARVAPGVKASIRAVVASYAGQARDVSLGLYFNDVKVASTAVNVPAHGRAEAVFTETEPGPHWTRGEVRIESSDALPQDDRFYFALEKTDLQTVAFVSGSSGNLSAKYMETALGAVPKSFYRFQLLAPSQLTDANIRSFAYIVVDAGSGTLEAVAADLSRYVRAGGAVWILLPRNLTPGARIPIAATTLRGLSQGAERGELRLDTLAQAHPVLEGLEGLRGVRFLSAWNVDEDGFHVLARLGDRTPVLLEKKLGSGRVLLMTSALDSASNDLPFQPVFVPFIERISRYMSGLTPRESSRRAGDFLEIRTPGSDAGAGGYEVSDPEGTRLVSRTVSLTTPGVLLDRPGFYKVAQTGGREEIVAVNVGAKESDLTPMDDAALALWKQSGNETPEEQQTASDGSTRRTPFGWYGFLILGGVLIAESVLADRFWRWNTEGEL